MHLLTSVLLVPRCSGSGGNETKTCCFLRVGAATSSAKAAASLVCLAEDWVQSHTRKLGLGKSVHSFLIYPFSRFPLQQNIVLFSQIEQKSLVRGAGALGSESMMGQVRTRETQYSSDSGLIRASSMCPGPSSSPSL